LWTFFSAALFALGAFTVFAAVLAVNTDTIGYFGWRSDATQSATGVVLNRTFSISATGLAVSKVSDIFRMAMLII